MTRVILIKKDFQLSRRYRKVFKGVLKEVSMEDSKVWLRWIRGSINKYRKQVLPLVDAADESYKELLFTKMEMRNCIYSLDTGLSGMPELPAQSSLREYVVGLIAGFGSFINCLERDLEGSERKKQIGEAIQNIEEKIPLVEQEIISLN